MTYIYHSSLAKVVAAHYHGAHGQFSGSGYKDIEVEGKQTPTLPRLSCLGSLSVSIDPYVSL